MTTVATQTTDLKINVADKVRLTTAFRADREGRVAGRQAKRFVTIEAGATGEVSSLSRYSNEYLIVKLDQAVHWAGNSKHWVTEVELHRSSLQRTAEGQYTSHDRLLNQLVADLKTVEATLRLEQTIRLAPEYLSAPGNEDIGDWVSTLKVAATKLEDIGTALVRLYQQQNHCGRFVACVEHLGLRTASLLCSVVAQNIRQLLDSEAGINNLGSAAATVLGNYPFFAVVSDARVILERHTSFEKLSGDQPR